jgi:hypothetical protein
MGPMQLTDRIQLAIVLAMLALAGCSGGLYPPPPRTPEQVEADRTRQDGGYARRTVILYNLQRVLDPMRSVRIRIESIKVVAREGGDERWAQDRLAQVLDESDAPAEVTEAVLKVLLKQDYPGLAGKVVDLLPKLPTESPLRGQIVSWLDRNAGDDALAEVVVLWAQEPADSSADARYRKMVEQMASAPWEQALIAALNSDAFEAKGSALEILHARIHPSQLRDRFQRLTPRTDALRGIRAFLDAFDYLPATGEDLLTIVQLRAQESEGIEPAGQLFRKWSSRDGYVFRLEDFHLLSRLSTDPLRKDVRRQQLLLDLGQTLKTRTHLSYSGDNRGQAVESPFWSHADRLSTADLWRLYLLNEMLTNRNVQAALYVTARKDRADKQSSWGGLVRYVSGRAQAYYYRSNVVEAGGNTQVYVPSRRAYRDARNSLCWFLAHFEKVDNAGRAGPDSDEIASMKQRDQSGVIFTSVSNETFTAHWYNHRGTVISLGVLPYGR